MNLLQQNPNNRLKMAIYENGRNAKSAFLKIALSNKENFELISAIIYRKKLINQIRLSSINSILGDNYMVLSELNK